jgi:hypothetical protein
MSATSGFAVPMDKDVSARNSYSNHLWPAMYLTDTVGVTCHVHFEGGYREIERLIQSLLEERS